MTAYGRGNYHERRCVDMLEENGYTCDQTRGSKGPKDIVASKPHPSGAAHLLHVQVKSGDKPISGEQWNDLYRHARQAGAIPVVADRDGKRGSWRLRRVVDVHEPHSRHWPSVPFVVDEVA